MASYEEELPKERVAVLLLPTYEGGEPCPTAKPFVDHLADAAQDFRVGTGHLHRLRFAIFGLGDQVYGENFCAVIIRTKRERERVLAHKRLRCQVGRLVDELLMKFADLQVEFVDVPTPI